jgi:uncharacterized protein (TIGR02996 family)
MDAVQGGDLPAVVAQVEGGAPVNGDGSGVTPLTAAAARGHREVLEYLLRQGADPNVHDRFGSWTPLTAALSGPETNKEVNPELPRVLVEHGADLNAAMRWGITPLHLAAELGDLQLVQRMVDLGADIRAVDDRQRNAADHAGNNEDMLSYLESIGVRPGWRAQREPLEELEGPEPIKVEQEPEHPDLEALIRDAPDDEDAYRVYADWLQEQGCARGEYIILEINDYAETEERRGELWERLRGPLRRYEFQLELDWQYGYIKAATVQTDFETEGPLSVGLEALETLLAHPAARFLQKLNVGLVSDDLDYIEAVEMLMRFGRRCSSPPALRDLYLGEFEYPEEAEISWVELGDLSPIWPCFSRLEQITLQGGSAKLGSINLPAARSFELRTGGLSADNIRAICEARWPELESLDLWFGDEEYGAEGDLELIRPILEGERFPRLRHLGLKNAEFTDAICDEIPDAPILGQLTSLDLSLGTMTDAGVSRLVSRWSQLEHLEELNVLDNLISNHGLAELTSVHDAKSALRRLYCDLQRDPDEEGGSYVSVGE